MWPRKRLDITWRDLFAASWSCAINRGRNTPLDRHFGPSPPLPRALPTLSVRSGLHLLLQSVNWPVGSEVLMSAMTIPDMARIVRHHGYVPIPIDLDIDTAAPTIDALERATTTATRGLVVAHLFGGRIPLDDIWSFANRRRIDVLEDCAQAFIGPNWPGTEGCLASFFSFGTIKTATACGGGVVIIRDQQLFDDIKTNKVNIRWFDLCWRKEGWVLGWIGDNNRPPCLSGLRLASVSGYPVSPRTSGGWAK